MQIANRLLSLSCLVGGMACHARAVSPAASESNVAALSLTALATAPVTAQATVSGTPTVVAPEIAATAALADGSMPGVPSLRDGNASIAEFDRPVAGCKPRSVNDHSWGFPQKFNASHVCYMKGPATSLSGTLFWTSSDQACLRVDALTVSAEEMAFARSQPGVNGTVLSLLIGLGSEFETLTRSPVFHVDNPEPNKVYSAYLAVRCTTRRALCKNVDVSVEHPLASIASIEVQLRSR
jgi:hypothetical protein